MNFKLNQSGTQSCYEVELGEDLTLLFSYKTLVAAMIRCGDSAKMKFFKVKNTWGPTTGRHINAFVQCRDSETVEPERLADLVSDAMKATS